MKAKTLSVLLLASLLIGALIPTVFAAAPTTDEIVEKASYIICSKEGTYTSVVKDDNGSLSIGCLQWHGNRALNLLRDIVNANTSNAKTILGDALYNEILTAGSWSTRILTADEASKISALLGTSEGKAEQDELLEKDVLSYIEHGRKLGITSPAALVYFADVENQCGPGNSAGTTGASRVVKSAQAIAGGGNITLAILHQAALADPAAGISSSRRNSVYNYAYLLNWEETESAEAYEVWKTDYVLNIRSGPGTSYDKVSQYNAGVSVVVYEQITVGSEKWGRTSGGWICLDYCTFISSHAPSVNSFPVIFDANGGDLSTKAKLNTKLNGVNAPRVANDIIVYTNTYGATTKTNENGGEVVIGADGYAQNTPAYGIHNSTIPTGGFVISAHGAGLNTLISCISKGDYVVYNAQNMTVEAYTDYQSYIAVNKKAVYGSAIGTLPTVQRKGYTFDGWCTANGTKITKDIVITATSSFTLTAKWTPVSVNVSFDLNNGTVNTPSATVTANALNSYRWEDYLVVYNESYGSTSGTNKYGSEALVNAAGIVTKVCPITEAGSGNNTIPSGGFVLSGHDKMSDWIIANIKVGDRIEFDKSTMLVSVFKNGAEAINPITATYSQKLGILPTPTRDGYTFVGWATKDGTMVTSETVSSFTENVTLYAQWTSKDNDTNTHIHGDVNEDGEIDSRDMVCIRIALNNDGINTYKYADITGDGDVDSRDLVALRRIMNA